MKIKGTKIEHTAVTVDVDPYETAKTLCAEILRSNGLEDGAVIRGDKIVVDEEHYAGSHSWFDARTLAENPTLEQINLVKSVNFLLAEARKLREKAFS